MTLLPTIEYTVQAFLNDTAYRRSLNNRRQMMLVTAIEGMELDVNPGQWRQMPRLYTVKEGDTLPKLATELYWKPDRWSELARINNLLPPYNLVPGQQLRLPDQ